MDKFPVLGVGAIVIKDNCILLVKRGHEPYKNQWAIPGGKVNWGETLQQAAEREIFEETSVVIKAKSPCYAFEIMDSNKTQYHYVVIDLFADYISGHPNPSDDAKQAQWFKLDKLPYDNINDETLNLINKLSIQAENTI